MIKSISVLRLIGDSLNIIELCSLLLDLICQVFDATVIANDGRLLSPGRHGIGEAAFTENYVLDERRGDPCTTTKRVFEEPRRCGWMSRRRAE